MSADLKVRLYRTSAHLIADSILSADLAKVNGLASKLGIGFVVVPR